MTTAEFTWSIALELQSADVSALLARLVCRPISRVLARVRGHASSSAINASQAPHFQMYEETSTMLITLECSATRGGRADARQTYVQTL